MSDSLHTLYGGVMINLFSFSGYYPMNYLSSLIIQKIVITLV